MRLPKYVPEQSIRHYVATFHVGVPDETIAMEVRKRLRLNPNAKEKMIDVCVRYALKCHEDNRKLYNRVMGGM